MHKLLLIAFSLFSFGVSAQVDAHAVSHDDVHDDANGYILPEGAVDPRPSQWDHVAPSQRKNLGVCTTPTVFPSNADCCSYKVKDQDASTNPFYRQPRHAFADAAGAEAYAQEVRARTLFTQPFSGSDAKLGHGWFYNNGGFHAGFDYSKTTIVADQDPTFEVRAIAGGKVVTVLWDDWLGNTVVIEHTGTNNQKYRSLYMHLRNGFTNDIAKAKAIPSQGEADSNWQKYYKFARLANPSKLHWGTDQQKIQVAVGATVQAGQLIAYAGNTGAGGAGNGLASDGTPNNSTTANNHLHFMMTVPDPNHAGDWMFIDPYGVYGQADTGCYELDKVTTYKRLFRPFSPDFHHVPTGRFLQYFDYYPSMGLTLQTVAVNSSGDRTAGSFQNLGTGGWYNYVNLSSAEYQAQFTKLANLGYRPRQLSVTSEVSPRFTAIWKKIGNESYSAWHNLSDADLNAKWNEFVTTKKYQVEDHVEYSSNGARRHAIIFVKDPDMTNGFYFFWGMSSADYDAKFSSMWGQGYRPWSISSVGGTGTRFSGVWRNLPGAWATRTGMSTTDYQTWYNTYSKDGLRPHKVSYAGSDKLSAIWRK